MEHLNNLRPITLANCDVKIITKSFANRMRKVMPEVIHESQKAYHEIMWPSHVNVSSSR